MPFKKDLKVHLSFKGLLGILVEMCQPVFLFTDPVLEQNVIFDIYLQSLIIGPFAYLYL